MKTIKKTKARFKVGDWVSFHFGTSARIARVVEDRGQLGINGRRIYRIRFFLDPAVPECFEIPEDDVRPAPVPDNATVMTYMKDGGLVDILSRNLAGGKNQPRAWLTYDADDHITCTFAAEDGLLGGGVVPFFALHKSAGSTTNGEKIKIFTPDHDKVVAFLGSFGLTPAEAKDVVAKVGTAP